jgi:surface protein
MFSGARAFNRDLSGWDTGNVTNMQAMFDGATQYNGNMINYSSKNAELLYNTLTGEIYIA